MTTFTATYSPDDNKLRLYATSRLDAETYDRVRAAGFRWAPKQELFVAPMWTPDREDLLVELAGEVGDEDKSLVDRQEERAERFGDYSESRAADAETARKAVDAIADGIPFGQPILVGHHSEKHARRDAKRIEDGMRKAVKMWETSSYWKDRAAGALRHAKYKESPPVRHRRIKTLTAEKRKIEKTRSESDMWLKLWTACGEEQDLDLQLGVAKRLADMCWLSMPRKEGDCQPWSHDASACDVLEGRHAEYYAPRTVAEVVEHAKSLYPSSIAQSDRWIAHYENRIAYETAMLDEQLGTGETGGGMAGRWDFAPGGKIFDGREWLVILRVNRAGGVVNSVTTTPPAVVTWSKTWKHGVERIRDYQPPTEAAAAAVKKANTLPPLCNYPGEGFKEMTEAEWKARKQWSDFSYIVVLKATEKAGRHRFRQMPIGMMKSQLVFLTDAKRVDPPKPEPKPPAKAETPEAQLRAAAKASGVDPDVVVAVTKREGRPEPEACTYPTCKCIVSTSTTSPAPKCPKGLVTPGRHECKAHGGVHMYVECLACRHEFCSLYWRSCPRCNGSGEGNRFPVADAPEQKGAAFADMKARLKEGVQVAVVPNLFPTPPDVGAKIVALVRINPGDRVLEPNAGTGALIRAIENATPSFPVAPGSRPTKIVAVELNTRLIPELRRVSRSQHLEIRCDDFLELRPDDLGSFDKVVMNPPFERGADLKHVRHALRFLKKGGRLVAIMADGPRQREWVEEYGTHWESLPEGTFAGTGVRAMIAVVDA